MNLFGITGGVGMGKSTAGDLLRQRGVMVADTDVIARDLVQPGQPALQEIAAHFGTSIIDSSGRLDRAKLAACVFSDDRARAALERILHPRIRSIWEDHVAAWRAAGKECGAVIIPLLFETGAGPLFDAVICLACSETSQRQRLIARGWSVAQIDRRNAVQWPIEKKITQSDYVVWTDTTIDAHSAQLGRVLSRFSPKRCP